MRPSTRASRAPVAVVVPASPCQVRKPNSAHNTTSFPSAGIPRSSLVTSGAGSMLRRSASISAGLRTPPPETTTSVTPYGAMARVTVSTVSSVSVASRSGPEISGTRARTSSR